MLIFLTQYSYYLYCTSCTAVCLDPDSFFNLVTYLREPMMPTYLESKITLIANTKTLKGGEPTFIKTDSLSFSRLTIFMATFWHVTQWTPSLTSPAEKERTHNKNRLLYLLVGIISRKCVQRTPGKQLIHR